MIDFQNILNVINFENFTSIDYFTIFVNFFILIFANFIISPYNDSGNVDDKTSLKIKLIRIFSFVLLLVYSFNLFIGIDSIANISQSALALISSVVSSHWINHLLIHYFGSDSNNDEKRANYVTRLLFIVSSFIISIITIIYFIKIWSLDSILETTGFFGIIALIIYATKDFWLGDFVSSFMLLISHHTPRGSLIKIESLNIFGIIENLSFKNVEIRDLKSGHSIYIPATTLRKEKVEVLVSDVNNSIRDYIDYKIGYGVDISKIEDFFNNVKTISEKDSSSKKSGIDFSCDFSISLIETGDHAVVWRLYYKLKQPRNILKARSLINKSAYSLQKESGIDLSTPDTHLINLKNN